MTPTVTITGGSGFVGQLLRRGLAEDGWDVRVFDPFRGPLVDAVRRRWLATAGSRPGRLVARAVRRKQAQAERALLRAGAIRRGPDDILAEPDAIAARFAGSQAVIHLAGIPHPHQPGATDADFVRLNYEAAVSVFAAAQAARVPTFVFASSAQVYRINAPVRLDQFPILETNPLPLPAEGQTTYGFLKAAFERYLDGAGAAGTTQAVALRLEFPGFRSATHHNLYVSTSVENLVAGFRCAVRPPADLAFGAFNIADAWVDPAIVDIQAFVRSSYPYVPCHAEGNACLLSTDRAQAVLGYRPAAHGHYVDEALVW